MTRLPVCALTLWLSLLSATVTAAVAGDDSSQPPAFAPRQYASPAGGRGIATADFNRDGWPDIAQANGALDAVTILLSREGTDFAPAEDVPVGRRPFELTAGDFNRDGIPDLAVANAGADSLSILIGSGDGGFARADVDVRSLGGPRGVTSADWNNDGALDLIVTGLQSRSVHVLLGTGQGDFVAGPSHAAAHPQGIATADFNHDGALDIAVANATGPLRILYGRRGKGFVVRDVPGSAHFSVLAAGDFNRDGWADLAAASTLKSVVAVHLGSAEGFGRARYHSSGDSPAGITAADVNHDGLLDLITANRGAGTLSVLQGDVRRPGRFLLAIEFAAASGSRDLVAEDFDGDGRRDLAASSEHAAVVTVLRNDTPLARAAYAFSRVPVRGPSEYFRQYGNGVWAADFNRDGRTDVATAAVRQGDEPAELLVFLTGGPTVALPRLGWYPAAAGVGDVNADGNPDFIYIDAEGIYVDLGNGRGGFTAAPPTPASAYSMAVGDLNRDGRDDVAIVSRDVNASYSCLVQTMISNGRGAFTMGARLSLNVHCGRPSLLITDLDRDGRADVAALGRNALADGNAAVWTWTGDGSGGLAVSDVLPLGSFEAADFDAADIDRDGDIDFVVSSDWGIEVVKRTPSGFSPPVGFAPDAFCAPVPAWTVCWVPQYAFDLADMDGNGTLDVITAGGTIVHNDGAGNFTRAEAFDFVGPNTLPQFAAFDLSGAEIAIADFTGDGLLDAAFVTATGEVGIVVNERRDVNRAPDVSAGPDRVIEYQNQTGSDGAVCFTVQAVGTDPDLHALSFVWRAGSAVVAGNRSFDVCGALPGVYEYSLEVTDGRGGTVTDQVVVTISPTKEIVLHFAGPSVQFSGRWSPVSDPTAASSVRAYDTNLGNPKVTAPSTQFDYADLTFVADPTQTYKLWLRLKADGDAWANDSLWIQFSGATDLTGTPRYRWGSGTGLAISLEECRHCGVQGWGWQDDGWGAPNTDGVRLRFPEGGVQRIVISTREDGVSVDQIVLSSERYLTARPGAARNDNTILPATR